MRVYTRCPSALKTGRYFYIKHIYTHYRPSSLNRLALQISYSTSAPTKPGRLGGALAFRVSQLLGQVKGTRHRQGRDARGKGRKVGSTGSTEGVFIVRYTPTVACLFSPATSFGFQDLDGINRKSVYFMVRGVWVLCTSVYQHLS